MPEVNAHARRVGVLGHVVERFLNDPVESRLDRGPRPALHRALHGNRQARALGDPFSQEFEGREQPEVIQDRWTEFMRKTSQLLGDLVEKLSDLPDALAT